MRPFTSTSSFESLGAMRRSKSVFSCASAQKKNTNPSLAFLEAINQSQLKHRKYVLIRELKDQRAARQVDNYENEKKRAYRQSTRPASNVNSRFRKVQNMPS